MARCGWRTIDGHRTYIPQCWGGLYDRDGCYCPKPSRAELEDRIETLERRVKALEERK